MKENKIKNSNKKPRFSIVMATYNRVNVLPRAIKSVLNQTFQDFELIIVNDGSSDDTEKVVKGFNDGRIIYFQHKKNKGFYKSYDTGVNIARGEFVVALGDDDELLSNALEIMDVKFKELSSREVKMLWLDSIDLDTGRRSTFREGFVSYKNLLCREIDGDFISVIDRNIIPASMWDKRSWADAGAGWIEIYHKNPKYKLFHVSKIVCKARLMSGKHLHHPETGLEKIPRVIFGQKSFLEKYGEKIKHLCPRRYGKRLALLGLYQILDGETIKGRGNVYKSFRFNFSLNSLKYCFLFLISFILNKNQIKSFYLKFLKIKRRIKSLFRNYV